MADIVLKTLGVIFPAASKQRGIWGRIVYDSPLLFPQPSNRLNVDKEVTKDLVADFVRLEGEKLYIYNDSRGQATGGIGHLITSSDINPKTKKKYKVGDTITLSQSRTWFIKDVQKALSAAKEQAAELNKYDADFILALTHVNFQLGIFWRTKFPNTWKNLKSGNWQAAVNGVLKSDWNKQTPVRTANFINAIKEVYA